MYRWPNAIALRSTGCTIGKYRSAGLIAVPHRIALTDKEYDALMVAASQGLIVI
jgi:hypothetical protein